jgi:rRNA maturation endonuclease Nob1
MVCPRCGSQNVVVQAVTETRSRGKGCLYWIFIGWWLETLLWIFLTIPMLLCKLFGFKRIRTKVYSYGVCQNCGAKWKIK